MVLSDSEVIEIIDSGVCPRIMKARKMARKNNMHVTGKGVVSFLQTIDSYETQAQKNLREKLVKSNRSLFSFILRPTDKIFTAKGGSIAYNIPDDRISTLKEMISDVADGLDIKKYLKKVVKKHYVIDPNGVLFIDIDPNGRLETHVVKTSDIFWYKNSGNRVDAIIFDTGKKELTDVEEKKYKAISNERLEEERNKRYYRVIDSKTDRIFVKGTKTEVMSDKTLDNYFGFVPALILGDEKSPDHDVFESVCADIIEDADQFLRQCSVSNIHDLAHLYPRYWSYAQACTNCDGEGQIHTLVSGSEENDDAVYQKQSCPSCSGSGIKTRTNPSDEIIVPVPMEGDPVLAPNLMGYVSPDLMTAQFYAKKMQDQKNEMFQAMWGTTYEQGGKRETATGRFLDAQPVQDRLRDMSDTFANMHKFMLRCYGIVIFRNPNYNPKVSYGTRYILDGPDDILKKYTESTNYNISEVVYLDLRNQYLEAEYQSDSIELMKQKKLANVEPFPTMKVVEVLNIENLPDEDRYCKMYYASWISQLDESKKILMTEQQLRQDLLSYVKQRLTVNSLNDE